MSFLRPNLTFLTPPLLSLAEEAGRLICLIYRQEIQFTKKNDGSLVTQADKQSHTLLREGLDRFTPHIPVISEEDPASWGIKSPLYWLVDPLDGTMGFVHKKGEFCVNIALMENHQPIFGLIHLPLSQESFYGYEGKAWLHANGHTSPIHTRSVPPEGMTLLLGGYRKKYKPLEDSFFKSYPITKIERLRSAIKFCSLASGKADIYLRFAACAEWDTAAGQALIEAAGGVMTNIDGSPFVYGKKGLLNEAFVVFGQNVFPKDFKNFGNGPGTDKA